MAGRSSGHAGWTMPTWSCSGDGPRRVRRQVICLTFPPRPNGRRRAGGWANPTSSSRCRNRSRSWPTNLIRFATSSCRSRSTRTAFVAGLEFRPGNARVAHHANIRIDRSRASRELDVQDPLPGYEGPISPQAHYPDGHFLGWTPGQLPPLAEPGMAWRVEPGSDFVIQLHMQSTDARNRFRQASACTSPTIRRSAPR